jgi:hypothetical protein
MPTRTEIGLRLPNSPGALAGVCRLLSDERVNINALSLDSGGQLRLILDNHILGAGVLRARHHQVSERDVLVLSVANAPGGLAPVVKLVADAGVNVDYAYGGTSYGGSGAVVVLGVDDAQRAAAAAGV